MHNLNFDDTGYVCIWVFGAIVGYVSGVSGLIAYYI